MTKTKCPTCGKSYVNLQEHITKTHTIITYKEDWLDGTINYMGRVLKVSGDNGSKDGVYRLVFEGWKKPKAGGYYHEFELAYRPETKEVVSFTECLTNGKCKNLMTKNIVIL